MRLCSNVPNSSLLSSPGERCPNELRLGDGGQAGPRVGDGDERSEEENDALLRGLSGDMLGDGITVRDSRRSWRCSGPRETCDSGMGTGDATDALVSLKSGRIADLPTGTRTPSGLEDGPGPPTSSFSSSPSRKSDGWGASSRTVVTAAASRTPPDPEAAELERGEDGDWSSEVMTSLESVRFKRPLADGVLERFEAMACSPEAPVLPCPTAKPETVTLGDEALGEEDDIGLLPNLLALARSATLGCAQRSELPFPPLLSGTCTGSDLLPLTPGTTVDGPAPTSASAEDWEDACRRRTFSSRGPALSLPEDGLPTGLPIEARSHIYVTLDRGDTSSGAHRPVDSLFRCNRNAQPTPARTARAAVKSLLSSRAADTADAGSAPGYAVRRGAARRCQGAGRAHCWPITCCPRRFGSHSSYAYSAVCSWYASSNLSGNTLS